MGDVFYDFSDDQKEGGTQVNWFDLIQCPTLETHFNPWWKPKPIKAKY